MADACLGRTPAGAELMVLIGWFVLPSDISAEMEKQFWLINHQQIVN